MMDDHRGDTAELVHGRIHNPGLPGHATMDHAWIEVDQRVWEPAHDVWNDQAAFDAIFQPEVFARYTFEEMRQLVLQHKHWGPWHQPRKG